MSNLVPLAEKMRPKKLADVIGQEKAVDLIKKITKNGPASMIFWGPPGTGKTTLARIIANEVEADFVELSAVTSGKKDIEKIIERARQNWNLKIRTVLFVDEIHRFNKAQQDAFLPHMESGLITLIGATTENPSFEVITPLLSRSRVIVLEKLNEKSIKEIILRASDNGKRLEASAIDYLAKIANGDARSALGNLELALNMKSRGKITPKDIEKAAGKRLPGYDKKGDQHYDTISAFIKSMRGSDVDATLYYLARMVEAGEDPKFIARRMVIFASEDIGLAGNGALPLATACFQAVERVGMPESGLILAHCAVALAKSKKSRATTDAWYKAQKIAHDTMSAPVPIFLRNASTKLMRDLGYGKGQKWEAGFHLDKSYLPEEIKDLKIFKN